MPRLYQSARIQGDLDGLCGVYAPVNAMTAIAGRSLRSKVDDFRQRLFNAAIDYLADCALLQDAIKSGTNLKTVKGIVLATKSILEKDTGVEISINRAGKEPGSLEEFMTRLARHYNQNGEGSAILGLEDHWSVVSKVHPKSIDLLDSSDMKRLRRRHMTTSKMKPGGRVHAIWPTQTLLISVARPG